MKLTFLGTRGNIPIRSAAHRMHSSLLVTVSGGRVRIDCGTDWLDRVDERHPAAIFVTHGHPDHAEGLRRGVTCPVYATAETWQTMARWPLPDRRVVPTRRAIAVAGLQIEAWPVEHATNAPAVGYRISAGRIRIFYVPDVARLADSDRALNAIDLYVGDGATMNRPLLRRRGRVLIGHATIGAQLAWCRGAGVQRAVFTHCGSGIVRSDPRDIERKIRALGLEHGVDAGVAHDGMTILLRAPI